ncbi:MAG: hypothetical protein U0T83_04170 [Bacteriovoracaceae bacterium]
MGPGDEPGYITRAKTLWDTGKDDHFITWSPGYVLLMSPFVGILGEVEGYKIWRFFLFGTLSLLIYFTFRNITGSSWLGLILSICYQMLYLPYISPSLQTSVSLILIISLFLLTNYEKNLGIVFAILINGIFISGILPPVIASFGLYCLIFLPKLVFTKRFIKQVSVGFVILISFIFYKSYNLMDYGKECEIRGRAGMHMQLQLFMMYKNLDAPYVDKPEDLLDYSYHKRVKFLDKYFLDKFGYSKLHLRNNKMDPKWPGFLLDWPWLIKKDPDLMFAYIDNILLTLKDSLKNAFQIIIPIGKYDVNTTSAKRGNYQFIILLIMILPFIINRFKKSPVQKIHYPNTTQLALTVCSLSILVPLLLYNPILIYCPPFIPAYLMAMACAALVLIKLINKKSEI